MSNVTDPEQGNRPLVSVVIPFLNAERFIDETIRSVFAQSHSEWELLLIDDGSTDGSPVIARRWAAEHPGRVRYVAHDDRANHGVPASRNLGLRHAKAQLVAFLDADDVWLPHKLEEQIMLLRRYPEAGMVYGLSEWWYSWTGKQEDQGRDFIHELGVPPEMVIRPPELIRRFFLRQDAAIPNPSDIIVKREAIDRVGGFEERVSDVYEDQAFYAKVVLSTAVVAAGRCWTRYRQHPHARTAVTHRDGMEMEARRRFIDWLLGYLSTEGCGDAGVWREARAEAWRLRHPTVTRGLRRIAAAWRKRSVVPAPGRVRLGHLRRITPISRQFGYDRGQPVDRYYIERFLDAHRDDIAGRVLEIYDDAYTRTFGGSRVSRADVLDIDAGNSRATIVGDLARPEQIPGAAFDCAIVTQTLLLVYDVQEALRTLHHALKPGGVLLATVPGISQISRYDMDRTGDYWRFTTRSVQRLCDEIFGSGQAEVAAHGNVLAASAFLYGLAAHELTAAELDHVDPDYQVVVTARAVKPPDPGRA